jgi:CubicO group peptidase (beta-lactamase class C family)
MTRLRLRPRVLLLCLTVLVGRPAELDAQTVPSPETQSLIDRVAACITAPVVEKDAPRPCITLQSRMAARHVPGVSVAVIHNGSIEWAQGFGVAELGGAPVTSETLFQAGSISKPVAAMAALHLVEQGQLSLDTDVNQTLSSWKIPSSEAAQGAVVTLRELLSHTAGLTVHGFDGYAVGAPIPSLVQILNGEQPANSDPIRLEAAPGSRWKYSGGGYTVMQQLVLDVSRRAFPDLMHDTVLAPIGMVRSTYEQPLPVAWWPSAATPYEADGTPVEGGFHTYPEMAAAGLWTTPADLARFAIEIQRSLRGEANHVLSAEMTNRMLVAGKGDYGLGLQIGGSSANPYFLHGGVDAGFESLVVAYEQRGDGVVVMTNAQGGQGLAWEVVRSVASVDGWPDFQPIERAIVAIDPAVLAKYVGVYEFSPTFSTTVTLKNGQLMEQATDQDKFPLFPEAQSEFFLKVVDAQIEFFTAADGQVSHLILHQNGHDKRGERKQ